MTREEVLRFGLDAAKDEYLRGQGRLGLVETKAQLLSATVGILLALLVTIPRDEIPHSDGVDAFLLIAMVGTLLLSLVSSLSASLLVDVQPPQAPHEVCNECLKLIQETGKTTVPVDPVAAEHLVGDTCGTYLAAATEVARLLDGRMKRLKLAQIALLFGTLLMFVVIGLPYLAKAITLINTGGRP